MYLYLLLGILAYIIAAYLLYRIRWWRFINWPISRLLKAPVTIFEESNYHLAETPLSFREYLRLPSQPLLIRFSHILTALWPLTIPTYLSLIIGAGLALLAVIIAVFITWVIAFILREFFTAFIQGFPFYKHAIDGKIAFIQSIGKKKTG